VGKTSISVKYVNNEFHDQTDRTINASYLEKKLKLESGQQAKMAIWVPLT
jgi:GTPase SAR1 family protein